MTHVLALLVVSVLDSLASGSEVDPLAASLNVAFPILILAGLWGVFVKAGVPGWAALVPVYSELKLLQVVGKPLWWVLLMLIPIVGGLVSLVVMALLAWEFKRGTGTFLGLVFLPFVFLPILGFGSAQYRQASVRRRQRS